MFTPSALVVADSISESGHRVTTIEAKFHRFILPEVNTHRVISKNGSSSRAVPLRKQIARLRDNPAIPVEFGTNQRGMQAGPPLRGQALVEAEAVWVEAMEAAIGFAERLGDPDGLNVHKQVVNRLLEPFATQVMLLTSTEWDNFFSQRATPTDPNLVALMQPEFRAVADAIRAALNESTPRQIAAGDFHTPYILDEEYDEFGLVTRTEVSAARCARTSYLTHHGIRDVDEDLRLFNDLVTARPPHWSPLEHVARPDEDNVRVVTIEVPGSVYDIDLPVIGNLVGWRQLRHQNAVLPARTRYGTFSGD